MGNVIVNPGAIKKSQNSIASNTQAITNYRQTDGTVKQLSTGDDLNSLRQTGRFWCTGNCANKPLNINGFVDNYVYSNSGNGYVKQVFTTLTGNRMFQRAIDGSTWSDWEEIALIANMAQGVNIHNESDPPSAYPLGLSAFSAQDNGTYGWDTATSMNYAVVTTFRVNNDYALQIIANYQGRMSFRASTARTAWSSWKVVTT